MKKATVVFVLLFLKTIRKVLRKPLASRLKRSKKKNIFSILPKAALLTPGWTHKNITTFPCVKLYPLKHGPAVEPAPLGKDPFAPALDNGWRRRRRLESRNVSLQLHDIYFHCWCGSKLSAKVLRTELPLLREGKARWSCVF